MNVLSGRPANSQQPAEELGPQCLAVLSVSGNCERCLRFRIGEGAYALTLPLRFQPPGTTQTVFDQRRENRLWRESCLGYDGLSLGIRSKGWASRSRLFALELEKNKVVVDKELSVAFQQPLRPNASFLRSLYLLDGIAGKAYNIFPVTKLCSVYTERVTSIRF